MEQIEYDFYEGTEEVGKYMKLIWNIPDKHPASVCKFLETFMVDHLTLGEYCVVVGGDGDLGDPRTHRINSASIDPPDYGSIEVCGVWDPETGEEWKFEDKTVEKKFHSQVTERISEWLNEQVIDARAAKDDYDYEQMKDRKMFGDDY